MSFGQNHYRGLWSQLLDFYTQIVYLVAIQGGIEFDEQVWSDFEQGIIDVLQWADLMAAADLRYRGIHLQTKVPDPKSPTAASIIEANPWAQEHTEISHPLIYQRAAWMRDAESKYLSRKAQAIQQVVQSDPSKSISAPMWRAERWRRDAIGEVTNVSEQIQLAVPRISDAFPIARYLTREDARVRPTHAAMFGFIASRQWQGWPVIRPKNGWGCFLPGTRVAGAFTAGLEARYDGPAIELETARGYRLRVTVNHPVMTPDGWVAAGSLNKGDTLLSDSRIVENLPIHEVDDQHAPSRIENVIEAMRSHGRRSVKRANELALLDLYGDARFLAGDIDVVSTDGDLRLDGPDFGLNGFQQRRLGGADADASQFAPDGHSRPLAVRMLSAGRSPRSRALTRHQCGIALDRHPFEELCLASPADGNVHLYEELLQGRSLATVSDRESFERLAGNVPGRHLIDAIAEDVSHPSAAPSGAAYCVGKAVQHHAVATEEAKKRFCADPGFLRDLCGGQSSPISRDEIVSVRRFEYVGHVYDLQSVNGWILSEGIVASNCRCYTRYVARFEAKRDGLLTPFGDPKFMVRWPNSASESNYEQGLFPDKGWQGPKFWSFPQPMGNVAVDPAA